VDRRHRAKEVFVPASLTEFFSSRFFMPHGHCYLWKPGLLWLQVLTNAAIGLAYMAITITLFYLVRRIRDIPFQWMYVAFGIFIVTCGFTHFFDIYVIWTPAYWLDGGVRAITAIASVGTALLLPPLVPRAIALAGAARVAHERGVQLEQVNRDLASLLDRTRQLEQVKTQFFASVSHELRTPLTLIIGPVQRLLDAGTLGAGQRQELELVARNADLLLRHVNDLLDVARLEAGKLAPRFAQTDLAGLVAGVAANFEGLARERQIDYTVALPAALPAQLDPGLVRRVLLNLLANAFKFTPAGGRIRCALHRAAESDVGAPVAHIEIADSGPGVAPEHRELIFERFRQVEEGATRRFGGTGLGLAIVREFVTLHGGSVAVATAPEGGALFSVELPVAAPPGSAVEARDGEEPEATRAAAAQTVAELGVPAAAPASCGPADRPLVLVVEDHPEMNRFVSETLAGTYRVESAFDGRSGLARACELRPDLIVSDMMMPELSGEGLIRAAREQPALECVPIILLTAKADDQLKSRLLREGAQDYLTKPFSAEELRARAGNLITAKRARDLLRAELDSQVGDLEALAGELAGRKRELEDLYQGMRVAREHAERASALKSNFLGLVSHEFRTPVTALQLQLERLRRDPGAAVNEQQRRIVERAVASAARLTDMIESLLHYASIEGQRLSVDVQAFSLHAIAAQGLDDVRAQAAQKGLQLRLVPDPGLPPLESDPRLVRLILGHLLNNAIKFTETGVVEVTLRCRGTIQQISVKDSGPGIDLAEQAGIFEPFRQAEQVRSKHTPGLGLGLALVRQLTEALGGHIKLQSAPERGTVITVSLPPVRSPEAGQ
jgi:signal transduction histidine kinase